MNDHDCLVSLAALRELAATWRKAAKDIDDELEDREVSAGSVALTGYMAGLRAAAVQLEDMLYCIEKAAEG